MRHSKIIGFSMPPEVYQEFESLTKSRHKNKSEFFRELIDVYFSTIKKIQKEPNNSTDGAVLPSGLAKILQSYWNLKSQSPLKIIVIGLGIIVNRQGKVLIGARKGKDPWVKNLTWVFPGGGLESLNFDKELKREIKEEANLDVNVKTLITTRTHPDGSLGNVQIVALYFYCVPADKKQKPRPADGLTQLKWVNPSEVFKYFTTSTSDEVTKFLISIEKG